MALAYVEQVPALALWMVGCAAFLYSDGEEDDERGPAILALMVPLLFVAILLFGPATQHGQRTATVTLGLLVVVLGVVLISRIVARRLRRSRARS